MKDKIKNYFNDIWKTKIKRVTFLFFFLSPVVVNIIIEALNRKSVIKGFTYIFTDFPVFAINYMIILATLSVSLLMRKRMGVMFLINAVWLGFGIANFVIRSKRETPFSATDLKLINSVTGIIEKYLTPVSLIIIIFLIVVVVVALVILWVKIPVYAEKLNYVRNIMYICIVWLVLGCSIKGGINLDIISEKFPNMTIAYQSFGFPYCFSCSLVNTGVSKPDDYSSTTVEKIVNELNETIVVDSDRKITPNIVFLQLESFFDVSRFKGLELSEEATPTFNRLKKEFPSGFLTVNNVGYGTANTEFEVMTGMNLDDFGPGEFPYKTVLMSNTCESMAYILKENGYATHAMHNNTATFYDRNKVFKNLGFDTFTSVEYMYPTEYTDLGWAKDKVLTDEIIKVLDSTDEKDYIYAISVQGHGSYPTEESEKDEKIKVLSGIEDEARKNSMQYYVNQINEMDQFIKELTDKLKEYDEDVVLVMYGDHLPSLAITEDELTNKNLYQTEYIIWSNFKLNIEDEDIETFQLGSKLLHSLNIDTGIINKFHQVYRKSKNYLSDLHTLTFDILYGNNYAYGGNNPYVPTDMKMGTYDLVLKSVEKADKNTLTALSYIESNTEGEEETTEEETTASDNDTDTGGDDDIQGGNTSSDDDKTVNTIDDMDNWYVINGEHFTKNSIVYVNGNIAETKYYDENRLIAYLPELKNLDAVVVNMKYKGTILSSSNEIMYYKIDSEKETGTTTEN